MSFHRSPLRTEPLILLLICACLFKAKGQCTADVNMLKKSALVVGESSYIRYPLKNPVNDAIEMRDALKRLGFSVTLDTNSSLSKLSDDVIKWTQSLRNTGIAMFYFAGHGAEIDGDNYLYPIDAVFSNDKGTIAKETYSQKELLAQMETINGNINILILDACRDDPTRSSNNSITKNGLAAVPARKQGVLIGYPVSDGNTTLDGIGNNSLYTQAILDNIERPNISINKIFARVQDEVYRRSDHTQTPYISSCIGDENDYCLRFKPSIYTAKSSVDSPDNSNAADIASFRRNQINDSKELDSLVDSIAPMLKSVADNAVEDVLDTIGSRYIRVNSNVYKDHWHSRAIYQSGIVSTYYGTQYQYRPNFIAEIKSNKVLLYITNIGNDGAQDLDNRKGLTHDQIFFDGPIWDIDWEKVRISMRSWYLSRLELLRPDN